MSNLFVDVIFYLEVQSVDKKRFGRKNTLDTKALFVE